MEKASKKKPNSKKGTLSSTNISQFKLEKNYAKKLIINNLGIKQR